MLGKPDREQFEYAIAGERAIVTHDHRDFLRLHEEWLATNHQHAGIVLTAVRSPAETAQRLANLLDRYTSDELKNGLFYV